MRRQRLRRGDAHRQHGRTLLPIQRHQRRRAPAVDVTRACQHDPGVARGLGQHRGCVCAHVDQESAGQQACPLSPCPRTTRAPPPPPAPVASLFRAPGLRAPDAPRALFGSVLSTRLPLSCCACVAGLRQHPQIPGRHACGHGSFVALTRAPTAWRSRRLPTVVQAAGIFAMMGYVLAYGAVVAKLLAVGDAGERGPCDTWLRSKTANPPCD